MTKEDISKEDEIRHKLFETRYKSYTGFYQYKEPFTFRFEEKGNARVFHRGKEVKDGDKIVINGKELVKINDGSRHGLYYVEPR